MTARTAHDVSVPQFFIGLMSGTSLDGVDAVLADCASSPPRALAHSYRAFPSDLRATLASLSFTGPDEIERAGEAGVKLAREYALGVDEVIAVAGVARSSVRAIGAHGQTVRHRPQHGYSIQLNAPAWLAELTGIDVVADFRSRDIAAGGQGAPLASMFHVAAFSGAQPRCVVNIGGISNLTGLPARGQESKGVVGFDCGPGNLLLDHWAQTHFALPFDRDGSIAASAEVNQSLLDALLADPFFATTPPKSTGRELFSLQWLERALRSPHVPQTLRVEVVLATLTRLTATAISRAMERWFPNARDVVLCGGGARNITLLGMLETECAPRPVMVSSLLGVEPDQVEALAFAWMAHAHFARHSGNLPSVTGARGSRVLGALYPA